MSAYRNLNSKDDDFEQKRGCCLSCIHKTASFFTTTLSVKLLYCVFIGISFVIAVSGRDDFYNFFDFAFGYNYVKNQTNWETICDTYYSIFLSSLRGPYFVYRISFGAFLFYILSCFFASPIFCVPNSLKLRLQRSILTLIFKIISFLFFISISFIIPDAFYYGYGVVAIILSATFIVIQLIVYIDWVYEWQEKWIDKGDDYGASCYHWLMLIFGIIFVIVGIILFIVEIVLFGIKWNCHLNRVVIIVTFLMGAGLFVLTLVRKKGILPGSVIFLYSAVQVWSALNSYPSDYCSTWSFSSTIQPNSVTQIINIVFSVLLSLFSVLKITISTSLTSFFDLSRGDGDDDDDIMDEEEVEIAENKKEMKNIFYALLVFVLSACYIGAVLSNWSIPISGSISPKYTIEVSIYAFAIKCLSILVMFGLYFWTLIAKYVCRCRDFKNEDDDD